MELAKAVRIVRKQTIPALAGSGGGGHVEALETVLAALEKPLDVPYTTSCGHTWTMRHTACPTCFVEVKAQLRQAEVLGDEAEQAQGEVERLRKCVPTAAQEVWRAEANRQSTRAEKAEAALVDERAIKLRLVDESGCQQQALAEIERRLSSTQYHDLVRDALRDTAPALPTSQPARAGADGLSGAAREGEAMSAHEDDADRICVYCGNSFDVHELLSPTCREGVGLGIDQHKAMSATDPIEGYYAQQAAQPSARELLDEWKTHTIQPATLRCVEQLAARVEAVLALHCAFLVYDADDEADYSDETYLYTCCRECDTNEGEVHEWSDEGEWPCATVRLLNGEKP